MIIKIKKNKCLIIFNKINTILIKNIHLLQTILIFINNLLKITLFNKKTAKF